MPRPSSLTSITDRILSVSDTSHHPFPRHSVRLIVSDCQRCRMILTKRLHETNRHITSKVHCDATSYQECDIACSRNLPKTFLAGICTVKSIRSLIPSPPCGMPPNGIPPRTEPVRGTLRPAGPLCPQLHLREYRRAAPYLNLHRRVHVPFTSPRAQCPHRGM